MTPTETVQFVAYLSSLFPSLRIDQGTPAAWYRAGLAFVSAEDARAAAESLAGQTSFVDLHQILEEVRRIRDRRIADRPVPTPATDPDRPAAWREELVHTLRSIADGRRTGLALTRGRPAGPPPVYWEITGRGGQMQAGRSVKCPWKPCGAEPGRACVDALGRPMRHSHPSRLEAEAAARGKAPVNA